LRLISGFPSGGEILAEALETPGEKGREERFGEAEEGEVWQQAGV